jgi:hypothetical protein
LQTNSFWVPGNLPTTNDFSAHPGTVRLSLSPGVDELVCLAASAVSQITGQMSGDFANFGGVTDFVAVPTAGFIGQNSNFDCDQPAQGSSERLLLFMQIRASEDR